MVFENLEINSFLKWPGGSEVSSSEEEELEVGVEIWGLLKYVCV